jgi:hypothetical protein
MNRHVRSLIAVGTASALCLGSYEVASAIAPRASVSATQIVTACATHGGSLRLAKASGKCPSGTTKIGLARPATAPRAMALDITSGTQRRSLPLVANVKLNADCQVGGGPGGGGASAGLSVAHVGKTQIDGTSFLTENGLSGVDFVTQNGSNETPAGASSVYSTIAGGFSASTESGFATLNAHLLVTVPGAVLTIDAIVDANADSEYCRISAEVESATT